MRTFYHHNWIAERLMAMTCYQNPLKRQNWRISRSYGDKIDEAQVSEAAEIIYEIVQSEKE